MKNRYVLLIALTGITLHATPKVYVHDQSVKANNSCFLALRENRCYINNTYLPQQVVDARNKAKQLPTHALSSLNKICYLKILLANAYAELIIQKEPACTTLSAQISKHNSQPTEGQLIRLYRKIEGSNNWKPIASIPEVYARTVIAEAIINPNGTINL